jgi:hypothetical protein
MTYDKVKGSGGASVAPRMTQTQKSLEEWLPEIETWKEMGGPGGVGLRWDLG